MPGSAVVAVDVGGTSIKAAVLDDRGTTVRRHDAPTPAAEGPDAVVAAVRQAVRDLTGPDVQAVGVVVPGVVDVAVGVARYSANLGWRDVPLGALLAADLGVPVAIEHDVRAAGHAERVLGRARGVADCLIVVLGTGIAGVVVSGGQHLRGATDLAGEIGHVPVYPDGDPCACGQRGCTETYASAAAIARRYFDRTGRRLTAEQVAAARSTDVAAAQVWDEAVTALGLALAGYAMLLDPSLVVLAGGLSAAGTALRDPVRAALAARLVWRPAPVVELSPLAGRAGQYGAALFAWRAAGHELGDDWTV
ncbi:MAG: ROK family protein [Jatrophihabitans sp.]|uniref:ROK family protein n=1 Tax=Jatrophihabitans sp. TaxID=1932789 RepID=UPI003914ADA0